MKGVQITKKRLLSLIMSIAMCLSLLPTGAAAASKPLSFIDTDEISGWARPAVQWAVEKGLMTGVSGNRIAPQVSATRGQAAVILMNFDQLNK